MKSYWWRRVRIVVLLTVSTLLLGCFGNGQGSFPHSESTGQPTGTAATAATQTEIDPTPSSSVDPQSSELRELLEKTAAIRDLPALAEVKHNLIGRSEVPGYFEKELEENSNPDERENDSAFWELLDQIEEGADLYQIGVDLLSEETAGFFDMESKELFVVAGSGQIGDMEKITFVHEFTHALQDQHFDLQDMRRRLEEYGDSEQRAALEALYEGDATLASIQYLMQNFTIAQTQELLKVSNEGDSDKLQSAPWMMQLMLSFPYQQGISFVSDLYEQGAWTAVDEAYADPPVSTEQVLHPNKYREREMPQEVRLPDFTALGPDWTVADEEIFGEFGLLAYLSQFVDPEFAVEAAAGWGGDRYALLKRTDGAYALAVLTSWDTVDDAWDFFDAYWEYMYWQEDAAMVEDEPTRMAWSSPRRGVVASIRDSEVLLVIAKDHETSQYILSCFPGF